MKLWLVTRPSTAWAYDVLCGVVVRAETEADARALASTECGDEGPACWLDVSKSKCEALSAEGKPGVIIRDFHAG